MISLGLALIALAVWAHFSSITPLIRGDRVSCGSIAVPVNYDIVTAGRCTDLIQIRHVIRAGALLALVVFVVLPLVLISSQRWTAQRSFRLSDGPTGIRWAARQDRERLRASFDDDVLTALGWSATDRDAFLDSLVSGWSSGVLVVTEAGIDRPIGAVLVMPASWKPLVLRLFFWIAPTRRAQGHGSRAVRLAAQHLFERRGVLIADASAHNPAAHAVLRAAGFSQTSVDDDRVMFTRQIDQPDEPTVSVAAAAKRLATGIAILGWATLVIMGGLLAWSVTEAVTEHNEAVSVAVPAGEIECGSLASRIDHDIDSYNRRCDGALLDNEADRFRGIATGSLSALGVLVAVGMTRMGRSASRVAIAERSRPLTPARLRDAVRDGEPLTDGRTRVRSVSVADADDVATTIDDAVMTAMGWPDGTPDGFAASVAHDLAPGMLVVTVGDVDRAVGVVSLEPIQPGRREPNVKRVRVGTWMGPEHRGQGHMTRALRLVAAVMIEHGVEPIAETSIANIAAQRAFERAGFVETGRRTVELTDGSKVPGIVFEHPGTESG